MKSVERKTTGETSVEQENQQTVHEQSRHSECPAQGKYAWTVKIGEKGQFVIPKQARDLFGFKPGDSILVLADINRGIAIPPKGRLDRMAQRIFDEQPPQEEG